MKLRTLLLSTLTALIVISCGGGGGSNFAGGIGGTGVSSGPVTGFGSVIVNGVEYDTTSASFKVEGASGDQSDLAVGMVVTVTHDDNGNAKSVSYKDNVEGPVSNKIDLDGSNGSFDVLGVAVTVDSLTVYQGTTGLGTLADGDVVEISGSLTDLNAVHATRVEKIGTCPRAVEVKGTVSAIDTGADTFMIGSLTVHANGHMPTNLTNGDYVEVKSNACPVADVITASSIDLENEGPDLSDLDAGADEMEIKGLVADFVASPCTFSVNGQRVSAANNLCTTATLADGVMVEVHGQLNNSGVLVASNISNEDEHETVETEYTRIVTVESQTNNSPFIGTISLQGVSGTFTTDLNTRFESETQTFNLDTLQATSTCAEVKINNADVVLSIERKDMGDCV